MKKDDYVDKLKLDTKSHVNNIVFLIKTLNLKIDQLKQSKAVTDSICIKFDIDCYNYNLANEMYDSKVKFTRDLEVLFKQIQMIMAKKSRNIDYDISRLQSINDLLATYEIQLNTVNKFDLSNIESLQLNAIKKEIYEKYMRLKAEIDKAILQNKFDKIKNRSSVLKALDEFFVRSEQVSRQRENLFVTIKGINDCISGFVPKSEPNREYTIIDILADISCYLNENKRLRRKYRTQYNEITQLKDKIQSTFSIDKNELKVAVANRYKSRYPVSLEKNVNKMKSKYKKNIEFLYKSGYVKSYQEVTYESKMDTLINKLKILSENVEREINR